MNTKTITATKFPTFLFIIIVIVVMCIATSHNPKSDNSGIYKNLKPEMWFKFKDTGKASASCITKEYFYELMDHVNHGEDTLAYKMIGSVCFAMNQQNEYKILSKDKEILRKYDTLEFEDRDGNLYWTDSNFVDQSTLH